jgi:hypothetical protein
LTHPRTLRTIALSGTRRLRETTMGRASRIVWVAALAAGAAVAAADYQPLRGSYRVGGATLYDPPENEPQDTHLYLDLEGNAARELYRAMKAKAVDGACGEPGDLTKRQGGVQCTMLAGAREYHCAFGIEIGTQKVVGGVVC